MKWVLVHLRFFWAIGLTSALFGAGVKAQAIANESPAGANHVVQIKLGQAMVALNGPWKFHTGDNPLWASAQFDDSEWETVDLTPAAGAFDPNAGLSRYVPGWTAKGHPGYWGYAWYRIRVQVFSQTGQKVALTGPSDLDDGYQFFDDGKLVGSFGKFFHDARTPTTYNSQPQIFSIPAPADGKSVSSPESPPTQVLAFRVWMNPYTLSYESDPGGFHVAPLIGEASVVRGHYELAWLELLRSSASYIGEAILYLLLAIMACSLILFDRVDPVYRWLGATLLLSAIGYADVVVAALTQIEGIVQSSLLENALFFAFAIGGWIMMWRVWFRLSRPMWMPRAILLLTLLYALSSAVGDGLLFTVVPYRVSAIFHLSSLGIRVIFAGLLIFITIQGIRKQGREGWFAVPAVALFGVGEFWPELQTLHIRTRWFPFGISITISQIREVVLVSAIFALLLRRLLLSIRHQRELALDIKQAQEVQKVLIPEELPHVPGLIIESEYRPAREVGGDFFQILPHATDGGVLIVVGDVTGKGLQAGMLVALIVGAIRTEARRNDDPLGMLGMLNERLWGRGHAHATCLALRIARDGSAVLANAGHLPPYLNGTELSMEGALPLGMVENAEFSVMSFRVAPGDRLVLMSDGIAEAQDNRNRLFGFDRIQKMLERSATAAEVADAAQNFGQQDDISVMSLTRVNYA
ncbi:MAG TPA: PP2C family protein-serine/threonine phosphatase [Acidobacteriaceae bacterium]|nr:PP2C family protein-serine/threonine phosphatase [Acidobacteriaceae bacterium]